MTRGTFSDLGQNEIYQGSPKQWYVELERSNCHWHELIVNANEDFDVRDGIADQLQAFKQAVQHSGDRRFIYFITSRKKVRFSHQYQRNYSPSDSTLSCYLEVGRERKLVELKV